MNETEAVNSFEYVHLDQIDPSFETLPTDFYNLKIVTAEMKEFDKTATGGSKGKFIKLGLAVTGHAKYSGRRVWQTLFPNDFTFRILRRVQDATGVNQDANETLEQWVTKLGKIGPTLKLQVVEVPDVLFKTGEPNPRTVKADGTPAMKNEVNFKAGVQPGD